MEKSDKIIVGYCLVHGREFPVLPIGEHNKCSGQKYVHPRVTDGNEVPETCPGPFAFCPPPEPLTEDEWEIITEKEYYRYAT
jgi:hypothetical protein